MKYYTSQRAGFSNRLKGLISLERAKQEKGINYSLNWTQNQLVTCDFKDLFLNQIEMNDSLETILTSRLQVFPEDDLTNYGPVLSNPNQRYIDMEYERIPKSVQDTYIPYFKWLKFLPHIDAKADYIVNEMFTNIKPIGVHYRNAWDWIESRWVSYKKYFEAIDSLPKNLPIYLITHDDSYIELFKERYGKRIFMQPEKERDTSLVKFNQDVAVETLVLSKLNYVIADQLSSFADVAWWIGGCQTSVIRLRS